MAPVEWVVFGPVAVMAKYRNILIRDDNTEGEPVEIGTPVVEPAGTPGRRAAISHPFPPRHLLRLRKMLITNGEFGAPLGIDYASNLPGNWVYPPPRTAKRRQVRALTDRAEE